MLSHALRNGGLISAREGFELRVGLPWIRSMPLAAVSNLEVAVDGQAVPAQSLEVVLGARSIPASALEGEPGWWFVQDRLVLGAAHRLNPGVHNVSVGFQLLVPYLQAGPGRPLVLPFRIEAALELDGGAPPSVSRDVA